MGTEKDKIPVCPQCERIKKFGKFVELTLADENELERKKRFIEFVPTTCQDCASKT